MDWSNPIPNITYSIIGGIILLMAGYLFKATTNKIKEDREITANIVAEMQKYLNPAVSHDLRQNFTTFITAYISSVKTFEVRFYFYWILCIIMSLGSLLIVSLLGIKMLLILNAIIFALVTIIGLYLTSKIGNDISQFEKTLWTALAKMIEALETTNKEK